MDPSGICDRIIYVLTLEILGKNSADDILKYFILFFSQKIGFDILCKLSPLGDNLHGMSKSIFWKKKKKKIREKYHHFVVCWNYPESGIKVNE